MKNLKTILKEALQEDLRIEFSNHDDVYVIYKGYGSYVLEMNGKAVKITKTLNPLLNILKSIEDKMYIHLDFINFNDEHYATDKPMHCLIEDMENYKIIEDIDFNRDECKSGEYGYEYRKKIGFNK